jgi:UDP-2,3-diacylglucosamine pyrophosphatase LpxH
MRATRAIVISDIHLANGQPDMISNPAILTQFINQLPALYPVDSSRHEQLELIIAGDFIDYLNIQEYSAWTPDPATAVKKLGDVTDRSQFAPVFDALAAHVARGHRLTILLGNHDVELALPQVQDALLRRLGASPHDVLYVTDGRAYRLGSALIEHGNRYDDANANDWTGLRAIVSALSRNESPTVDLEVSAGSKLVIKVVNPLKDAYPFVNLLQPVGELLLLLLLEFEPSLAWQVDMLGRLLNSKRLAERNRLGQQPGATRNVSAGSDASPTEDPELATLFGDAYRQLHRRPSENIAAGDVLGLLVRPGRDGLAAFFERGTPIP